MTWSKEHGYPTYLRRYLATVDADGWLSVVVAARADIGIADLEAHGLAAIKQIGNVASGGLELTITPYGRQVAEGT